MKLFTEKEFLIQSQHFAFRLKNLYCNDKRTFYQLQDYMPQPVYINDRRSLDYHYFNEIFFSYGPEIRRLYMEGKSYLPEISNSALLKNALLQAKILDQSNDFNQVSNYLQIIKINKKSTPFYTNKVLIDNHLSINTTLFPYQYKNLESIFKSVLPEDIDDFVYWQKLQSLTKREKEIIQLISKGKSNKDISEILILSSHSIHTHRRNIYRKLDVSKTAEVVKIAIALDLI